MRKLTFGLILLLSGCVSTNITSNKAPGYTGKIERLYIMVRGSDSAKPFFNSFNNSLSESLKSRGIETSYYYFDPLSLENEDDVMNKINEFGPNLVMMIQQTESRSTMNQYGWGSTNTGGTFDIKLLEPDSKSPVWRANLKADAQFGLTESARRSSEKLIEKLILDKLL
ncbi:hypothetical protein AB9P05_07645 [Roseivirga sp. BDSF3-8]|uniref:hypothetical protein n=1 Tax=Roseivirga sp. BDSF3-8 TaxID=3241598 RepID=UPI00353248E8